MSYRRDHRSSKSALFDGVDKLEEGGLRASSSFSHEIKEHDNDKTVDSLQDRVAFLKRGNGMDVTRGIMSGTMDRFKKVFEKKSNRRMCTLVVGFVVSFLIVYYLIRTLRYIRG
ncbi:bet1-like SNARE 1-2 isoform X2 [Durio zibethinus]|uniref:Bet1-like SNARE 1-2 isoform X2 n=1 Tax=Durio zibethinus TaxID=66656 RepID=A0A6P6A609_DURZI|nr:bet1-like SNARE 1-2 isoform X2 [Durio zibethinus]